ncbi:MAG: hypothetical protein JXA54_10345 [Candidatus Heimdallarchaeota archaeon]|nr:hypothetical protein [Candidatus Heimdallarchaeota archaeon]
MTYKSSKTTKIDDKKHIHVVLEADRFKKFLSVKKTLNQNSDVDVVRFCIDEVYERLNNKKIDLKPILESQIKTILDNEYLRNRYLVLDYNDVINDSVYQWILNKRSEINLHHLPFRQSLDEEEQLIANFFIENQYENHQGITIEDIEQKIRSLSSKQINNVLQKFLNGGLISTNQIKGIDYYYATLP